jgi:hypothetical protein
MRLALVEDEAIEAISNGRILVRLAHDAFAVRLGQNLPLIAVVWLARPEHRRARHQARIDADLGAKAAGS